MRKTMSGNHLKKNARMPEVSQGACERCKEIGLLGNGICADCWDKGRDSAKKVSNLYNHLNDDSD